MFSGHDIINHEEFAKLTRCPVAMKEPLVSIMMPAYNVGKYIGRAIESVLAQTYENLELIIVDDCSTDNTYEIAAGYKDPRIRILRHEQNMGVGPSRNDALSASTGQWVAVLDADDEWLPERLERLIKETDGREDLFLSDLVTMCFDRDGSLILWRVIDYPGLITEGHTSILGVEDFLKVGPMNLKPLFPMSVVRNFQLCFEDFHVGEDIDFWAQLFRAGLKLKLIGETYYLYRLTPGSLTSKTHKVNLGMLLVYEKWITEERTSPAERELWTKLKAKTEERLRYEPFANSLKSRRFPEAIIIAFKDPRVLVTFVKGIPSMLSYRISAVRVGVKPPR